MKTQDSAADLNRQLEAYAAVGRLPERNPRGRWGKWPIYAAATGAALAGASAASADIFSSGPINVSGHSFAVDYFFFNVQVGVARHEVSSTTFNGRHVESFNFVDEFASVGNVANFFTSDGFAKRFAPGAPISVGTNPYAARSGARLGTVHYARTHGGQALRTNYGRDTGEGSPRGPFLDAGFLGFEVPGSEELGWMRVQFDPTFPGSIDVTGWSYNTDGPINAGETGPVVPEPNFLPLVLLASGAVGVLAWKRRRSRQAPSA